MISLRVPSQLDLRFQRYPHADHATGPKRAGRSLALLAARLNVNGAPLRTLVLHLADGATC